MCQLCCHEKGCRKCKFAGNFPKETPPSYNCTKTWSCRSKGMELTLAVNNYVKGVELKTGTTVKTLIIIDNDTTAISPKKNMDICTK